MPKKDECKDKLIALRLTERDLAFVRRQAEKRKTTVSGLFRLLLNLLRI